MAQGPGTSAFVLDKLPAILGRVRSRYALIAPGGPMARSVADDAPHLMRTSIGAPIDGTFRNQRAGTIGRPNAAPSLNAPEPVARTHFLNPYVPVRVFGYHAPAAGCVLDACGDRSNFKYMTQYCRHESRWWCADVGRWDRLAAVVLSPVTAADPRHTHAEKGKRRNKMKSNCGVVRIEQPLDGADAAGTIYRFAFCVWSSCWHPLLLLPPFY